MSLRRSFQSLAKATATLGACAGAIACHRLAPSTDLLVGEFGAFTGAEATFGENAHKGITLATEERNERGGIKGRRVRVVRQDNQGKPDEAVLVVTRLIAKNKVVALLGEASSSRVLAVAPIANRYGVSLIAPSATNLSVTQIGEYIFRACFTDPVQGAVMARFAVENLRARRIAILRDVRSDYSEGLALYFGRRLKVLGGSVVADEKYSAGDIDFKAQLTVIRGQKPDAVFIPGYYADVALIARQARQLNITVPLLGGDGWESPRLREIAGPAIDGAYFSTHFVNEARNPRVQNFARKFKVRFGHAPDGLNALSYDSARMLFDAIERAVDFEPNSIRDEIARTKAFPGVTGDITMDRDRNPLKDAVVVRVDGFVNRFVRNVRP